MIQHPRDGIKHHPNFHAALNVGRCCYGFPVTVANDIPLPLWIPRATSTTFQDNLKLPVHRWFRYSAGYSADWARSIISEAGARRVLDPFAGSGTTLLAAQHESAESIGLDPHPFVAKVAATKLLWHTDVREFEIAADRALLRAEARSPSSSTMPDLIRRIFTEGELVDLLAIRSAVEEESNPLLWLALVSVLRKCSHAGTAQWQYVLPNKSKSKVAEPYSAFRSQVALMAQDMRYMQAVVGNDGPSAIMLQDDARTTTDLEPGWADLVLTSPPYANNFDYADATRVEMSFLGEIDSWADLKPLRALLIRSSSQAMSRYSAEYVLEEAPEVESIRKELKRAYLELAEVRRAKAGGKAYHTMAVAYFHDLALSWTTIRRATRSGGRACFVVGDSAPYGVHLPVERWLGELAVGAGFESWTFDKVRTRNDKWKNRKHTVPLQEGHLWVEG